MGDEREARRWRRERFDRIIREDIRDVTHIRELQLLEFLIENLNQRERSASRLKSSDYIVQTVPGKFGSNRSSP